jgi:hypothetical protein
MLHYVMAFDNGFLWIYIIVIFCGMVLLMIGLAIDLSIVPVRPVHCAGTEKRQKMSHEEDHYTLESGFVLPIVAGSRHILRSHLGMHG